MRIETSEYEFSHGKKPRGIGRWAFDFFRNGSCTTEFCPYQCSLTEAKRWAQQEAKQIGGIVKIQVGS